MSTPLECASCGGRMRFVEVTEDAGRARSELRRMVFPALDADPGGERRGDATAA